MIFFHGPGNTFILVMYLCCYGSAHNEMMYNDEMMAIFIDFTGFCILELPLPEVIL